MSLPLAVYRERPWWAPWRSRDLDGQAVLAALVPMFASALDAAISGRGGDPIEDLTQLVGSGHPGDLEELSWQGHRLASQWTVHAGDRGVRRIAVDVWDDFPDRPLDEFATELRLLVEPLRRLALATGARLHADAGDVTHRSLNEIIDLVV
jgi:hypothetical protein